jgi:hypothetical protein
MHEYWRSDPTVNVPIEWVVRLTES